ncbi:hypothetical protein SADUNF_Sadunf06G0127300 [Salix dunnii]|uniref:Nudix hydrolase domain-containing protein n=1 Tax=Salix dunnii TaxID=1413687 RepID=A0A835MVK0_9ROSI|nr:hypothetical protein SADUNF_Sadunf06G0127300 [Salix dunnii]
MPVLPFRKGRPFASSTSTDADLGTKWHLGWISLPDCKGLFDASGIEYTGDSLIYLGSSSEQDVDVLYWAIDVSGENNLVNEFDSKQLCFIELRTLMVATDWADEQAMTDLAVAGYVYATLPEHCWSGITSHVFVEIAERKLFSWNLGGGNNPGESLEEAVRRETWEENAIEVGEVMYHSSQPWPVLTVKPGQGQIYGTTNSNCRLDVNGCPGLSPHPNNFGPSGMPCQLMAGFFAYAKSLEIKVDKVELEDAQWHSREDVRKALMFVEYEKAQRTAAAKVDRICRGVEKGQRFIIRF